MNKCGLDANRNMKRISLSLAEIMDLIFGIFLISAYVIDHFPNLLITPDEYFYLAGEMMLSLCTLGYYLYDIILLFFIGLFILNIITLYKSIRSKKMRPLVIVISSLALQFWIPISFLYVVARY